MGEKFMALGCLFSIAGPVTFKNGQSLRDAVVQIPLERLMVETDAPYLTPHPHRGNSMNRPMSRLTAEKVAEVKGVSLDELARITSANAIRFLQPP